MKLTELEPAGTKMLDATVAFELVLEVATRYPPVGAKPVRVTVAMAVVPPTTVDGAMVKLSGTAALMVP